MDPVPPPADAAARRRLRLEPTLTSWLPFAIGLVLLAVVAVLTTRQLIDNAQQQQVIETRLLVVGEVRALQFGITEAGSAQRGYIITRQPIFRQRQAEAIAVADAARAGLAALADRRPDLAAALQRLGREEASRRAEIDRVDALIAEGRDREAAERVLFGRMQLDSIRSIVDSIAGAEERQLALDRKRAEAADRRLLVLVASSLLFAALLLGASIAAIRRRSEALAAANAELGALAGSLEQRVRARTAELAEANAEIQRFAYVVSHDLRSPLVNIMGFTAEAEAARDEAQALVAALDARDPTLVPAAARAAIASDLPESLAFIRAASERMDRLIRAILQLSRLGRRRLVTEEVDLAALVAAILTTQKAEIDAAGARIAVDALPAIHSDRLALEQIFGNLFDNALKYLRPDVPGLIRVGARDLPGGRVAIDVADNGRGIAEADRERVFELFRRAGPQDRPGEGIGLAHVRTLVRSLGGSVSVGEGIDGGSRFTVTLPRVMAPAHEEGQA